MSTPRLGYPSASRLGKGGSASWSAFLVDGRETNSSTWDPTVDQPTERSHTVSWNKSKTTDRGWWRNGSVEAWLVHGKSTANNATCHTLLDEVDYTPPSYNLGLGLAHKTVNYSTLHPLSHRNKIGDKFDDPTTVTV